LELKPQNKANPGKVLRVAGVIVGEYLLKTLNLLIFKRQGILVEIVFRN
jgi:hypothetical protein